MCSLEVLVAHLHFPTVKKSEVQHGIRVCFRLSQVALLKGKRTGTPSLRLLLLLLLLPVVLSIMAGGCFTLFFFHIYESAIFSLSSHMPSGARCGVFTGSQEGWRSVGMKSQGVCFKGFLNVWSLCPEGFFLFSICPSQWNFLGLYCPLLKAPVTMVTATPK